MKKNLFLARLTLFHLLLFFLFPPLLPAKTLHGKVLKVFDGDTLLVRVEGREEHVRLREIDAPEVSHAKKIGQEPWGGRSRDFLRAKVRGKAIQMEVEEADERDKYGRLLAYAFVNQDLLNREMIRSGNALFYPPHFRGRYAADLQQAEVLARERGIGVFHRQNGLQETPQEFRSRTNRDEGLFSRFKKIFRGERKKSQPREYPVPPDKVVANQRSKVYHMPGSHGAVMVSPKNRMFFDSPEEAERAGFRRARTG